MNQHDQMRALIDAAEEDSKNEHDSDDVLNKSGNVDMMREALRKVRDRFFPADQPERDRDILWDEINQALAAEPAPLVRLNDDALVNIYLECKAEWKATNKRQRQRIAVMFGNAIMNAMERANK